MTDNYPLITRFFAWITECHKKECYDTNIVISHMGLITGTAAFVNDMVNSHGPNVPRPVLDRMQELSLIFWYMWPEPRGALLRLMEISADEEYYEKLRKTICEVLFAHIPPVLFAPRVNGRDRFRQNWERHAPMALAREFMTRVRSDFAYSELKKKQTKQDIDSVLASLLLVECFANGMFSNQNMHGPNALKQEIVQFKDSLPTCSHKQTLHIGYRYFS